MDSQCLPCAGWSLHYGKSLRQNTLESIELRSVQVAFSAFRPCLQHIDVAKVFAIRSEDMRQIFVWLLLKVLWSLDILTQVENVVGKREAENFVSENFDRCLEAH